MSYEKTVTYKHKGWTITVDSYYHMSGVVTLSVITPEGGHVTVPNKYSFRHSLACYSDWLTSDLNRCVYGQKNSRRTDMMDAVTATKKWIDRKFFNMENN